jgi:hypothetical protein
MSAKRTILAGFATLGLLASASSADANSLKYKNGTTYGTIFTAHAFRTIGGFTCFDDGCSGSGVGDYRFEGWWSIAPGGVATVYSYSFHEAWHEAFAFDSAGHVWQGPSTGVHAGHFECMLNNAFSQCGDQGYCNAPCVEPKCRTKRFYAINDTACCTSFPGLCSGMPTDAVFTFNP